MSITLSSCSSPSIRSCAPGSVIAPFRSRASASRRMSPTSELLPEPETPVTQTNSPSGNVDVDVLEVVVRAPLIVSNRPSGTLRAVGNRDRLLAREVLAGQALGDRARSSIVPWATTSPPLTPGPGPKSTRWSAARIVSSSCSTTTTVLPSSASRRKVASKPIVVARMQADRRLVEDVEHAHQPRADLAGQADPLGLAAGERRRRAIERQVMQADVDQEREPGADLLEQLFGDRPRDRVERHDIRGSAGTRRVWASACADSRQLIEESRRPGRWASRPARPGSCRRP